MGISHWWAGQTHKQKRSAKEKQGMDLREKQSKTVSRVAKKQEES